jgi:galactokinase
VAAGLAARWTCTSTLERQVHELDLGEPATGHWSACLEGVIRQLRAIGAAPPGANVAVAGGVPGHTDPAYSGSLAVAAAKALSLLAGRRLSPAELLDVCFRTEPQLMGTLGRHLDQTIATHGQRGIAFLLESGTGGIRSLPFPCRVWVMHTDVSRDPSDESLGLRLRQFEEALAYCRKWRPGLAHLAQLSLPDLEELQRGLPPPLVPPVRYVVAEAGRARMAAGALAAGDVSRFGRLMVEGHYSLKQDYDWPSAEADILVGSAVAHGAYGARLTTSGGEEAVIMLAPPESEARILAQVSQDFQDRFGRVLQVWSTRAAAGIRRETVSSKK